MPPAVALRGENVVGNPATVPSSDAVLARYRRLREINKQHHDRVLDFVPRDTVFEHARRLGLAIGTTLVIDDIEALAYAFDLAIYTAPAGRSRAIDRYARSAALESGSDEALMLEAMCGARFAIVRVERRHEAAGLIVNDVALGTERWLVDEGLESSLPDKALLATRLYRLDGFCMTAGASVPLGSGLLNEAFGEVPHLLRKEPAEAINDRRFAAALYRVALADGILERIMHKDAEAESD